MMIISMRDRALVEANPYSTANIKRVCLPEEYGINNDSYGGNIRYIAELKDSNLLLIISKKLETIDVAISKDNLDKLSFQELRNLGKSGKRKLPVGATKEDLINLISCGA